MNRHSVDPLGPHHDRASFSCGEPSLDRYIHRQASQDARRRVARVFVASDDPPERIVGYYTLSAASFEKDDLPIELAKRLPHYPVPAAVIGRLAVDLRSQGNGLGEVLLLDAICRVIRAGDTIGVYAVVVDALHDRASASMKGTASCRSRRSQSACTCRFGPSNSSGGSRWSAA